MWYGPDLMADRVELEDSGCRVVVCRCDACRRATVETSAGPVELSSDAAERLESGAEVVTVDFEDEVRSGSPDFGHTSRGRRVPVEERDRPNTPALRAKLRAVAAEHCENPMCRRRIGGTGHGHHVVLRSEGGRTSLVHEVYVCVTCHALAHTGALTVAGDRVCGFQWRVASEEATRAVRASLRELNRLSDVCFIESPREPEESGSPENAAPRAIQSEVAIALRGLGSSRGESKERVSRASGSLASREAPLEPPTAEQVLGEALRVGR